MIGGAKFAFGISCNNGQWDAGIIIDSDIFNVSAGKLLARASVEAGMQSGDFVSNHGSMSTNLHAGYGMWGGSLSSDVREGGVSGAAISFGPQIGVQISGQQTRTLSYQKDIKPLINRFMGN